MVDSVCAGRHTHMSILSGARGVYRRVGLQKGYVLILQSQCNVLLLLYYYHYY